MPAQATFEDLGVPLSDVTFCVVDLETTGGSPASAGITEIGAIKVRRGEVVGTLHSLVDPGEPVPAFIRLLTGITDDLLVDAPPIETVLPSFLEFARGTVLVAHNARFDVGFLNAALERGSYPRLSNPVIDTARLARKILAEEVPNRRLETLARHLRCAHQPSHRAYADALATVDVLHCLIERVSGFGVTTLEDFVAISRARLDGTFSKIALTDALPRGPGVYRFLGADGSTLYVGKATDVRARVRSYFYSDDRAKIRDLLRETDSIVAEPHATTLEAEVAESRAIARETPLYNRAGKRRGTWYLKASIGPRSKIALCRAPKDDGSSYLGPFRSAALVRIVMDGLRDALSIHRCARPERCSGCAFSEMRRCVGTDPDAHRAEMSRILDAFAGDAEAILEPLRRKMTTLARAERYEEAIDARDRGALVERSLRSLFEARSLIAAGDLMVGVGSRLVLIRNGQLAAATDVTDDVEAAPARLSTEARTEPVGSFLPAHVAREARLIASWLERNASVARVVRCDAGWALPLAARPSDRFTPNPGSPDVDQGADPTARRRSLSRPGARSTR